MAHRNAAVLTRVGRSGMGLVQPVGGLEALQAVLAESTHGQWAQVIREFFCLFFGSFFVFFFRLLQQGGSRVEISLQCITRYE